MGPQFTLTHSQVFDSHGAIVEDSEPNTKKWMKTKGKVFIAPTSHQFIPVCLAVATLLLGTIAASAQTGNYLYSGSELTITLNPGTYDITAYGAQGGNSSFGLLNGTSFGASGGLGAEMSAEFFFSELTSLTLLVGGGGGGGNYSTAGGGGGSFVVNGSTPLVVAGRGGGAGLEEYGPNVNVGGGQNSTSGGTGCCCCGGFGGTIGNGGCCGSVAYDFTEGGGGGGYMGGGTSGGGFVGSPSGWWRQQLLKRWRRRQCRIRERRQW